MAIRRTFTSKNDNITVMSQVQHDIDVTTLIRISTTAYWYKYTRTINPFRWFDRRMEFAKWSTTAEYCAERFESDLIYRWRSIEAGLIL